VSTKAKSKYDTTPADVAERSEYPQGYYPNGEWAGFFAGETKEQREEVVIAWCKKEEGRTFNWVPLPKPEPREVGVEEKKSRKVKKFVPAIVPSKNSGGRRKPSKAPSTAPRKEENIEWDVDDIKDDTKMESVAKKSQDEAIKKLTAKKVVKRKKK
jgi:hypothetical protein